MSSPLPHANHLDIPGCHSPNPTISSPPISPVSRLRANSAALRRRSPRPPTPRPVSANVAIQIEPPSFPIPGDSDSPPATDSTEDIKRPFAIKRRFLHSIRNKFSVLGAFIFDYPLICIFIFLLISIIGCVGLINPKLEMNPTRLYSLPKTRAAQDKAFIEQMFPPTPRISLLLTLTADRQPWLLNAKTLLEIEAFTDLIYENLTVPNPCIYGKEPLLPKGIWRGREKRKEISCEDHWVAELDSISFADICSRNPLTGKCKARNLLRLYTHRDLYGTPMATAVKPTFIDFKGQRLFRADHFVAEPVWVEGSGGTISRLTNATGLAFTYELRSDAEYEHLSEVWEEAMIKMILDRRDVVEGVELYTMAQRSWVDELAATTSLTWRDMKDYFTAFILISSYACITHFSFSWSHSKSLCAFIGAIAALLGYGAGSGLCYLLGLAHVPTINAAPFLILGIGMDDAFVLLNAYSLTFAQHSPRERCAEALKDAGLAITTTTLTNLISFTIGAVSRYVAVRNFCVVAAVSLLAGYLAALFFFFPILCLVARSESKTPVADSVPLDGLRVSNPATLVAHQYELTKKRYRREKWTDQDKALADQVFEPKSAAGWIWRRLILLVTPIYSYLVFKVLIILLFTVLISTAILGILELRAGLPLQTLTPPDSYLRDTYAVSREHFYLHFGEVIAVVAPPSNDWWSPDTLAEIGRLEDALAAVEGTHLVINPLSRFFISMKRNDRQINETTFPDEFSHWLSTSIFAVDFADCFSLAENGDLQALKIQVLVSNSVDQSHYLRSLRKAADPFVSLGATAFAEELLYYESDGFIMRTTLCSMATAFIAIAIVSSVFLNKFWNGVLLTFVILQIDVCVFGFMNWAGLQLNLLTMILLILSIGFSVDYTVHMVHGYNHTIGDSGDAKTGATVALVGPPVTHGFVSSMIGIAPIAFREEYIFLMFFKMTAMVLVFGYMYGTFLLPVLLSWVGVQTPKKCSRTRF